MNIEEINSLLQMPSIAGIFPLKIPSGKTVSGLGYDCGECGTHHEMKDMRGRMTDYLDMISIKMAVRCRHCGATSARTINFYSTNQMTETRHTGETKIHRLVLPSRFARLSNKLKQLIKKES